MRKQSSKIIFIGIEHCEMYFRGYYHDKAYLNGQLVWEKLNGEVKLILDGLNGRLNNWKKYSLCKLDSGIFCIDVITDTSTDKVTSKLYKIENGEAKGLSSFSFSYSDYIGEEFFPSRSSGNVMIIGVRGVFEKTKGYKHIYISKNGSSWTGYSIPETIVGDSFPTPMNLHISGVCGDTICIHGFTKTTSKSDDMTVNFIAINLEDGTTYANYSNTLSGTYYLDFLANDSITRKLYAVKVDVGKSGNFSYSDVIKRSIIEIPDLSFYEDGKPHLSYTELKDITNEGILTDNAQNIMDPVNGKIFIPYGPSGFMKCLDVVTKVLSECTYDSSLDGYKFHGGIAYDEDSSEWLAVFGSGSNVVLAASKDGVTFTYKSSLSGTVSDTNDSAMQAFYFKDEDGRSLMYADDYNSILCAKW